MPSPIPFTDFRRWFERHGVQFKPCGGGGSHYKLTRRGGRTYIYIVPLVGGRHVKYIYLAKARKALKLSAADGIPDEDFFK